MPDSLPALEALRSQILHQFLSLGDLRPGSVSAVVRRCGKPTCHCSKSDDPGHDPQFRLTRRVSGKTVTESFPGPASFESAQKQVAEFHRFQQLCQELVAVNDKICALRSAQQTEAQDGWTPQEKKRLLRSMKRSHAR